jgi:hypothetical protein
MGRVRRLLGIILLLSMMMVREGWGGGIGGPLDGWLLSWVAFVQGLGVVMFITGLAGAAWAQLSHTYGSMISWALAAAVTGGIFAAGPIIAAQLGLVAGATLP